MQQDIQGSFEVKKGGWQADDCAPGNSTFHGHARHAGNAKTGLNRTFDGLGAAEYNALAQGPQLFRQAGPLPLLLGASLFLFLAIGGYVINLTVMGFLAG